MTSDDEVARDRGCLVVVIRFRYRRRVVVGEPDHGLVQVGTASGLGGEKVIGNVRHDRPGGTLRPTPARLRRRPQ